MTDEVINYEIDSENCFCRVTLTTLSLDWIHSFSNFLRSIKITNIEVLVIDFHENLSIIKNEESVSDRLVWSKSGQLMTNLLENLPFPCVSVIRSKCFGEYVEIALACRSVWLGPKGDLDFAHGEVGDFTCFGSLKRFHAALGPSTRGILEKEGGVKKAWSSISDLRDIQRFQCLDKLFREVKKYPINLRKRSIALRRMLAYECSQIPTTISSLDFLEATVYSSQPFLSELESITFMERPPSKVTAGPRKGEIALKTGMDDIGNDYMDFKYYPDWELHLLKRKSRLEEVRLLLEQSVAPIRGRCIELGSGYGYFSALVSKSSRVKEAIALDISAAEMFQLGPFMWEKLKPDWTKFSLRVSDMNKLDAEFGEYDTVIFCASLHHSGDIPMSLKVAERLLKKGGTLVIHGEHYDPVYFKPKRRRAGNKIPHTIPDFSLLLKQAGLKPKVFRYVLNGGRFPWLKRLLFTKKPLCYLNGWFRFHSFMMLASKD